MYDQKLDYDNSHLPSTKMPIRLYYRRCHSRLYCGMFGKIECTEATKIFSGPNESTLPALLKTGRRRSTSQSRTNMCGELLITLDTRRCKGWPISSSKIDIISTIYI